MKRITTILSLLTFVAAGIAVAGDHEAKHEEHQHAHAVVGEKAPDFTLADSNGKKHSLSDFEGKYVVLEWINFDCPFVKKHYGSNNMQALQSAYTKKGVVWLGICSSAQGKQGYFDGDDLTERMKKEAFGGRAYLVDADGSVGHTYEAKTTPHMYVIDPEGMLVYAGAIDDRPSTKQADVEGATNYVQLALDASMTGEEVETDWTKSYGCSVKYQK